MFLQSQHRVNHTTMIARMKFPWQELRNIKVLKQSMKMCDTVLIKDCPGVILNQTLSTNQASVKLDTVQGRSVWDVKSHRKKN